MTPETKKRLAYGTAIVVAGGVGIFVWKKYGATSGASSSSAADAAAQAQAQASSEETQLAELSELGSSGASLESPNIGEEAPVEDFGSELSSVLQAVGLEPVQAPVSGSGSTPATPPTTATGSTGTTPTPVTPPLAQPVSTPVTTITGEPISAPKSTGPIEYSGPMPERVINPE